MEEAATGGGELSPFISLVDNPIICFTLGISVQISFKSKVIQLLKMKKKKEEEGLEPRHLDAANKKPALICLN